MTSTISPDALWAAARVRGTLALVTGRGERAPVYERFGRRLSADGYTVAVFEGDTDRATGWLAETDAEGPKVLVGSDTGAAAVLRALTRADAADGAIVAGLVLDGGTEAPADALRTACPVHLGVLAGQSAPARSAAPVEAPAAADLAAVAVPVLAVHGAADPVAPIEDSRALLASLPDLEFIETVDGLHDALNDRTHRSVAATIVLWLERLRDGDVHEPIVRTVTAVRA